MQWFKRYYELNRPAADYDPVAQRAGKGGPAAPGKLAKPAYGGSCPGLTPRSDPLSGLLPVCCPCLHSRRPCRCPERRTEEHAEQG